jgi:hypothetical protein
VEKEIRAYISEKENNSKIAEAKKEISKFELDSDVLVKSSYQNIINNEDTISYIN